MNKILISWVGMRMDELSGKRIVNWDDLKAAIFWEENKFDTIALLYDDNYPEAKNELEELKTNQDIDLKTYPVKLENPNDHEEIFTICAGMLDNIVKAHPNHERYLYIRPGTAAMHAVWIFLAKTRFIPTNLVDASRDMPPKIINLPFEISIDFVPGILHRTDKELLTLEPDQANSPATFQNIIARSSQMREVLSRAKILAKRSIPILLEGETGTGKSLLARSIHDESERKEHPFIHLNCGGLTESLVEAELFGIEKNVASGVDKRKGVFEEANEGTLFLDEIGELPLSLQTRLLLTLENNNITRVGSVKNIKVDVRIIAATNKHLINEVQEKRFRADLFYRLAGANLPLPNLKSREGDLTLLINGLLDKINKKEIQQTASFTPRTLSAGAKNKLLQHHWPGNIRELDFTLRRAVLVFSAGPVISIQDIENSLLPSLPDTKNMLSTNEGSTFDEAIRNTIAPRITAAWESTHNKSKAARLLGIDRSRFSRLVKKHNIYLKGF